MASLTQRKKLKALFEQSMEAGGPKAFRTNWEQSVGIVPADGDKPARFDAENRLVNHEDWHVGEVMHTLLGNSWRETYEQFWQAASQSRFESFGGAIMGGQFPLVSAGLDVIAGLMHARALQAAAAPEWIWDRMCTVEEATGEGGFHIGMRSRGNKAATDLADGQQLPTAEVTQTRIHRNRTLNQGLRTRVNYWAIRDDLTSQIMEAVDANAQQVLAERERKVCDALLAIGALSGAGNTKALTVSAGTNIGTDGLAMPCVQDGLSFLPYQKGLYGANVGATIPSPENGLYIQNFANACETDGLGLTDYTALTKMVQIMLANLDPFTGLPVPINFPGMTLFCAPTAEIQMKFLLQAEAFWQIAGTAITSAYGTNTISRYNLVESLKLNIISSQFWANRLVTVGTAKVAANGTYAHQKLTNAVGDTHHTAGSVLSAFYAGDPKRAVHYWQRMPYQVVQPPLSSVEFGEQTVIVQDVRERGQAFWVEPRAMYRAWA